MSKTKGAKGKGRRGGKKGGRKGKKRTTNVADYAAVSCKQTITAPGGGTFQPNTLYNFMNAQLIGNLRAVQVAQAYQHYRIKHVAITFKPLYDTFTGAAGAMGKPNLYYMIDKAGSIPLNVTLEAMKSMGARPIQLDEKNLTVHWSPSVLESAMYIGGAPAAANPAKYSISPWLATNANSATPGVWVPSGIDHLGLHWYVDQLNPAGYAYTCEIELQFEFKKPLLPVLAGTPGQAAQLAVINDSPDGVVGGADGV